MPELSPPGSPRKYVVALLHNPARRLSVLLVGAYVAGFGGVLLSLAGNPADPKSTYGVAGILLMGTAFLCMFGLSITVLNIGGADSRN